MIRIFDMHLYYNPAKKATGNAIEGVLINPILYREEGLNVFFEMYPTKPETFDMD